MQICIYFIKEVQFYDNKYFENQLIHNKKPSFLLLSEIIEQKKNGIKLSTSYKLRIQNTIHQNVCPTLSYIHRHTQLYYLQIDIKSN